MKKTTILLSALISSVVVLSGCSSKTEDKSNSTEQKKDNNKDKETTTLGTPLTFENEVEITIKKIEWTDERNPVDNTPAKKVLLVTYDLKNISEQDYPAGTELNLYVNGKKTETYPLKVTFENIPPNRTLENATQAFAVNEDGDLELEVLPIISLKEKKIIKLNL